MDKSDLNVNYVDSEGRNAVHWVINPLSYGSYENVNILKMLHKRGFDLRL
jgi:hypothetical protein